VSSADVLVIIVMAIPIAAVVLAVLAARRWRGAWRIAAVIPLVVVGLWTLSLLIGWPYEHTLWPFELLVYGVVCLAYMLVLRYAHGRWTRNPERSAG
jgi:hypothetical protein